MLLIDKQRHLMGPERPLDLLTVDNLGPVQPFGERSTIIGQRGRDGAAGPGIALDSVDRVDVSSRVAAINRASLRGRRLRRSSGSQPQPRRNCSSSSWLDAGQDGRVADLVAVEMQDRQHRAVPPD